MEFLLKSLGILFILHSLLSLLSLLAQCKKINDFMGCFFNKLENYLNLANDKWE